MILLLQNQIPVMSTSDFVIAFAFIFLISIFLAAAIGYTGYLIINEVVKKKLENRKKQWQDSHDKE